MNSVQSQDYTPSRGRDALEEYSQTVEPAQVSELVGNLYSQTYDMPQPPQYKSPFDIDADVFAREVDKRAANHKRFQASIMQHMVESTDYGSIAFGKRVSKPSLLKPGAEKICIMLGLTPRYPQLSDPAFLRSLGDTIVLECELLDAQGTCMAQGMGARTLSQDSNYGGQLDVNKSLKMAAKSAMVDAAIRVSGLSSVFTQDLEDMKQEPAEEHQRPVKGLNERTRRATQEAPMEHAPKVVSAAQVKRLEAEVTCRSIDRERLKGLCKRKWGVEHFRDLDMDQYQELDKHLPLLEKSWAVKKDEQVLEETSR